jgi:lipopolysaccharide export system protein LptA
MQYFTKKFKYLLVFITLVQVVSAQQKSRVEILGADLFEGQVTQFGNSKKLIGNVKLKQENTLMYCDSAILYDDSNTVKAYSNVRINHNDSIHMEGDYLKYEGNSKKAYMEGNVKMYDKSMNLTTNQLNFDMENNVGFYLNNATIISDKNNLKSQFGYYYSRTRNFFFKKNVVIVNPDYTMKSDTLMYNTISKTSYFYGSTVIEGKKDKITCENGWYDTKREVSQFSKNAVLYTENKMLKADSLFYDRKNSIGKAFNNIELYDSIQKIKLYGNYGITNGKTKKTFVTQNPYALMIMDKNDSLFLYADSIFLLQTDKKLKQKEAIKAYHKVKIFMSDIQGVCDSLIYQKFDSTLSMFSSPIIWNGVNQITADTIHFYINNNKLDSFDLRNNSFLISNEKGLHYNQLKGKNMKGFLDSSSIKYLRVYGNGQNIYYAKEDSVNYIGISKVDCSEMEFYFLNKKISKGVFITNPEGLFYPLDELKPEELRLRGFVWREKEKPQKVYYQYKK